MKFSFHSKTIAGLSLFAAAFCQSLVADPLVEAMDAEIEAGVVSGTVTLVADREGVIHHEARGLADLENQRPMAKDSIFWIASMTKPITGVAVMMLEEEGKLALNDKVSKHLPEYTKLENKAGESVEVTIRQLLTHTAGLSELTREEDLSITTLKEMVDIVVEKPVQFPVGSEWRYSQTGINTAGRIVEVISGLSFPEFLNQRLFGPLGMADTTFYPSEEQLTRMAVSYNRIDGGALTKAGLKYHGTNPITAEYHFPRANGGLFSTASDYGKFARMILRDGELDGKRYLKPETIEKMIAISSGDLKTGFTPGNGWGIGWCVVREPQGVTAALSPMSFGHGGAYATQGWIDPIKGRVAVLMVQRANIGNGDASNLRGSFQTNAAKVERAGSE